MQLLDVNILVYAFRKDSPDHGTYKQFLEDIVNAPEPFGVSDLVMSGFLRVVTHPKVFTNPDPIADALDFTDKLRSAPQFVPVAPGARHWNLFTDLCRRTNAKGNIVPDAYHAALAIEHGCEWISTDQDYARFPGLKWRRPFAGASL